VNRTPSIARVVGSGALGYALLGAAGLMLTVGAAFASPLFPAAGVALAWTLRFGWPALGGEWLGSFALNVGRAASSGSLGPRAVAVAAAIASGAAAGAAVGTWLVRRVQRDAARTLEREQDAFTFLLLGGVVAGVVSATVGVGALSAAGLVDRADLLYDWWTWYVGDVLGVTVFAPLTLCWICGADPLWRERRGRIAVPMILILVLQAVAFRIAATAQVQADENRLARAAKLIIDRVGDRLVTHREVLASVRHFVEAIPSFTFEQFSEFTRITLQDNPDVFALSINDVVAHERRAGYERAMSRLSPLGAFRITERDGDERLVRARDRAEYVAVRYIVPLANNERAVGYDIGSDLDRRAAIDRARASGTMAVTEPIRLVQERRARVGVLELMPVTSGIEGATGGTHRILGFAVAVVKVDEMIDTATRGYVPAGLTFQVIDRDAAGHRNLLYRSDAAVQGPAPAGSVRADWTAALRTGDRHWIVAITATPAYHRQQRSWLAWRVGVPGLVFATLVQILLLGMTGRTAVVQRANEALLRAEEELRALTERIQTTREEEQARIARDLHDELGQLLTALKVTVRGLENKLEKLPPSDATGVLIDQLVEAGGLVDLTVASVHRVVSELRSAALDQLGLPAALRDQGRRFGARTGIECHVDAPEDLPPLPRDVSTALYRIAQEALTNVVRHAGASRVDVRLAAGGGEVTLRVDDDGRGIQPAGGREDELGVVGMRERATRLGGELAVTSGPRGGTTVRVRIPLAG
jgi:signal transduction histidine kinase